MQFERAKAAVLAAIFMVIGATGAMAQGACPTNAMSLQGTSICSCSGATSGAVWGSGPYTADSNICRAAQHAGAIGSGGGMVQVTMSGGMSSYPGSSANGVSTSNWGQCGSSFSVYGVQSGGGQACGRMPQGQDVYVCSCAPGAANGTVWGTGTYTDDSNICAAAQHSGVIGAGGGNVRVLAAPGLQSYRGSNWNGITTSDYGSWGRSIIFDRN